MSSLKCYRVWFRGATTLLVDAESHDQAKELARLLLPANERNLIVNQVWQTECLDEVKP